MRNDNDDDYTAYEDTAPEAAAPAAPSDEQILAFVQANIDNPALIAETAAQYGVSVADLSRATGYDANAVVSYFQQADVAPPAYEPPPTGGLNSVVETSSPVVQEVAAETPAQAIARIQAELDEKKRIATENLNIAQVNKPVVEPPPPPEKPVVEPPRPPERPVEEPPRRPDEPPPRPEPPRPQEPTEDLYSTWAQDQSGNPYTKQVVGPRTTYRQNADGSLTQLDERGDPIKATQTTTGTTAGTATAADATTTTTAPTTTTAATTTTPATTTPAATTLPAVTDYQGHQYDGTQLLTLAQQIANNAGTMTGGAFQTKGENIGFAASEANKLLGRTATASEQVLLDMARQMMQTGITDLSQLKTQDITGSASVSIDPDTGEYYALVPSADGETSTRKNLTPDQVAKIRTEEVVGSGDEGSYVRRTIDDLVTGKGLFANGKLLSQANAIDNPIEYTIGNTYTGGGGTSYQLKIDEKTGKPVVSASGFTTSDADSIMPIIMIASNFLLPGVGSMLTSTLAEAGLGELASQVVSKSIINGVTSGIMAEASGGKFGDGFLKGAVTGAVSAGVAPMISTALPSDLSPAMSTALTKAGTAVITALATGKDVGTALGTQLLNSAVGTGLSSVTGEMGLSTADAKLLNSVLTPVITQLVTNGNVNDATIMNAVMLAGSTVLANTGSVTNTTNVTTGDDTSGGGLNLLARDTASTLGTGLGAVSTATGLLNKATSLTKPTTKVNTTKANLVGALKTNTSTAKTPITKTTTAKTTATPPAALGALNTAKKTMTAQQISALKASKPATQVNVANLTPIKKSTPPQKVDVKTLIPVKTAQLPAGLNTKKMG